MGTTSWPRGRWSGSSLRVRLGLIAVAGFIAAVAAVHAMAARTTDPAPAIELSGPVAPGPTGGGVRLVDGQVVDHLAPPAETPNGPGADGGADDGTSGDPSARATDDGSGTGSVTASGTDDATATGTGDGSPSSRPPSSPPTVTVPGVTLPTLPNLPGGVTTTTVPPVDVTVGPINTPPVSVPPVSLPPVTLPGGLPPVTVPPITVPITVPPIRIPPITVKL